MDEHNSGHHGGGNNRTLFSILAYLGPLVIVSFLVSKHDPFVKYHIKQGLVVFGIEVVLWAAMSVFWPLWMLYNLVSLGTLVLSIIGIINVVQNKEKELPLVGHFASRFSI